MKDMNKIFLLGRLGNDPIQRETQKGLKVVHFALATSRRVRSPVLSEGEERVDPSQDISGGGGGTAGPTELEAKEAAGRSGEETQWHRIISWGKQAEACFRYLKKGQPVLVEGMVRSRRYQTKEGEERYSFEVHAENIRFLGGPALSPS